MYTVAILPWLELGQPLAIKEFELIPVDKFRSPDANTQAVISRVVDMHRFAEKVPAERSTILKYVDRTITDELSKEDSNRLYDFVELLAFSGMSARKFYCMGHEYCCRDNFQLAIFTLSALDSGFHFNTRRRDGSNSILSSTHKFPIPDHVAQGRTSIDIPLLKSLVDSWNDSSLSWWPQVFESILSYNVANTDNSAVPEHFEIISLVGAFQRLLDTGADARKLRAEFNRLFAPSRNVDRDDCLGRRLSGSSHNDRVLNDSYGSTVRDVWLQDLCNLRGNVAHGKIASPYQPIWSVRNHLLLASYAFPLLVKCFLASRGVYELSAEDRFDIDVFELQACEEHFDEFPDYKYPWNEVRYRFWWKQRFPWADESEIT